MQACDYRIVVDGELSDESGGHRGHEPEPLVLAVDDEQWFDAASASALRSR
jgi:hypothetical protein